MDKHYNDEFKQKVVNDYKSGKYSGRDSLSKHYNILSSTIMKWNIKDKKR